METLPGQDSGRTAGNMMIEYDQNDENICRNANLGLLLFCGRMTLHLETLDFEARQVLQQTSLNLIPGDLATTRLQMREPACFVFKLAAMVDDCLENVNIARESLGQDPVSRNAVRVEELEAQVQAQAATIAARDATIAGQVDTIAARDATTTADRATIDEQATTINEQATTINEQETRIQALEAAAADNRIGDTFPQPSKPSLTARGELQAQTATIAPRNSTRQTYLPIITERNAAMKTCAISPGMRNSLSTGAIRLAICAIQPRQAQSTQGSQIAKFAISQLML